MDKWQRLEECIQSLTIAIEHQRDRLESMKSTALLLRDQMLQLHPRRAGCDHKDHTCISFKSLGFGDFERIFRCNVCRHTWDT